MGGSDSIRVLIAGVIRPCILEASSFVSTSTSLGVSILTQTNPSDSWPRKRDALTLVPAKADVDAKRARTQMKSVLVEAIRFKF